MNVNMQHRAYQARASRSGALAVALVALAVGLVLAGLVWTVVADAAAKLHEAGF